MIKSFKIARKKHDLICLKIFDPREMKLPNIGIIKLLDAESKKHVLIDTSNKRTRQNLEQNILEKILLINFFLKKGIDLIKLSTSSNYIKPLNKFFQETIKKKVKKIIFILLVVLSNDTFSQDIVLNKDTNFSGEQVRMKITKELDSINNWPNY